MEPAHTAACCGAQACCTHAHSWWKWCGCSKGARAGGLLLPVHVTVARPCLPAWSRFAHWHAWWLSSCRCCLCLQEGQQGHWHQGVSRQRLPPVAQAWRHQREGHLQCLVCPFAAQGWSHRVWLGSTHAHHALGIMPRAWLVLWHGYSGTLPESTERMRVPIHGLASRHWQPGGSLSSFGSVPLAAGAGIVVQVVQVVQAT